jgi:hypothetical protein
MKMESDEYKTTGLEAVVKYLGAIMALAYIGIGAMFIARSETVFHVPGEYAVPLGILLIAYGLFRGYKVYQRFFQK